MNDQVVTPKPILAPPTIPAAVESWSADPSCTLIGAALSEVRVIKPLAVAPPAPVTVNFKVLVVDNGCAIKPFVTALDGTTEPKTWYVKISVKLGKANKPLISVPKAVAMSVNA